jgi:hypothetical protein
MNKSAIAIILIFFSLLSFSCGSSAKVNDTTTDAGDISDSSDAASGEIGEITDALDAVNENSLDNAPEIEPEEAWIPEKVCRPGIKNFSGTYFAESTEKAGLKKLDATGMRVGAADLDGDGYADFAAISSKAGERKTQRLFMNRPDPDDSSKRIFMETTQESNIWQNRNSEVEGRVGAFFNFGDFNNDGVNDIFSGAYIPYSNNNYVDLGDRSEVLLNQGKGIFSISLNSAVNEPGEIWTGASGPKTPYENVPWSTSEAIIFDYDLDGNLDIYVGNWYVAYGKFYQALNSALYKGNGDGTFENVTESAGLKLKSGLPPDDPQGSSDQYMHPKPVYALGHCDYNNDGWQDILASSYGRQWNDLFRNNGDKTFTNVGAETQFAGDADLIFTDNQNYLCYCYNNAGKCPEAINIGASCKNLLDCHKGLGCYNKQCSPMINCKNTGWYPAYDEHPWRLNGNTFGAYCIDFDNDGDMDVYLAETTHFWAGESSDRSQLLVNSGEKGGYKFERPGNVKMGLERYYSAIDWNEGDHHAIWIDVDNDGLEDLFVLASWYPDQHGYLFKQKEDHKFEDRTKESGAGFHDPNGVALADYDHDGDVDMIVSYVNANGWDKEYIKYFENKIGEFNNFVSIRLTGGGKSGMSSRNAIGARVKIVSGGVTQMKEIRGGEGGFGQQDEFTLTFGLGSICAVDEIQVMWPDSSHTVEKFTDVIPNTFIEIKEGAGKVKYIK